MPASRRLWTRPQEIPVTPFPRIPEEIVAKYDQLEELPRGGMSVVYRGFHRTLERWDAIKLLLPSTSDPATHKERFLRGARAASRIEHPNLVRIYDSAIAEDGTPYLVMELVRGPMLSTWIERQDPPNLPEAFAIAEQILSALEALHRGDCVHRDISPRNILLQEIEGSERLQVKIVDLGIARHTEPGETVTQEHPPANHAYASPEHFDSGRALDPRSDLYSCGVVLYELFTGKHPYPGRTLLELMGDHVSKPPLSFDVTDPQNRLPGALCQLLERSLAKKPEDRYPSAAAMLQDLQRARLQLSDSASHHGTRHTQDTRKLLLDSGLAFEAAPLRGPEDHDSGTHEAVAKVRGPLASQSAPARPARSRGAPGPWAIVSTLILAGVLLGLEAPIPWPSLDGLPPLQTRPVPGRGLPELIPTNDPQFSWSESFEIAEHRGVLHPELPYVYQVTTPDDLDFRNPVFEGGLRTVPDATELWQPLQVRPMPTPDPLQGLVRTFLADGDYIWRAARQRVDGELFGFSTPVSFRYDTTPAAPPEVVTGLDRPTNNARPIFEWRAPADATTSILEIARDRRFNDLLFSEPLEAQRSMRWQVPESAPLPEGTLYWRLGSRDAADNPVQYTEPTEFVVDLTPPAAPDVQRLEGPLNNPRPLFLWTPVSGAVEYRVLYGRGEQYRDFLPRQSTTETRFRPTEDLPEKPLAWWIAARDEAGNWSDFTSGGVLEMDYTAPPAPEALCAAAPLTNDPRTPLSWQPTPDTARYHLELATDPNLFQLLPLEPQTEAFYQPSSRLPEGKLFWRVSAEDAAGNRGSASQTCELEIDTVPPAMPALRPIEPEVSSNLRPDFDWSRVDDAVDYLLEIAHDTDFKRPVSLSIPPQSNSNYLPNSDLPEGLLHWRVKSRDRAGNISPPSEIDSFRLDITPPRAPELNAVRPNPIADSRPLLAWQPVDDAVRYRVQVAKSARIEDTSVVDKVVQGTELRVPRDLTDGFYFWRVLSQDAAKLESAAAGVQVGTFEVDTTPPQAPTLEPLPSTVAERSLTVRWFTVHDATTYLVEWRHENGGTPQTVETGATEYTLTQLEEGPWEVLVAAYDAAGNPSEYSQPGRFVVDRTPPDPPPLVPVESGQGPYPYLHWKPVLAADFYVVEILTDLETSSLFERSGEVRENWYQPAKSLPLGRFYWRVKSCDDAGNCGRFSRPGTIERY